ncbi:ATP-grasp domain-containing protein [Streptomyces kasugaensis]|uniref:ATP-grasp domain-containing protein n=1 Tax=Streptomyces kasugaensis TaxID=1946 RepID=UPI0013EF5F7B|nr:ATP-dependent carboxylate-amine ligase [Streptomyces kasugaensis]
MPHTNAETGRIPAARTTRPDITDEPPPVCPVGAGDAGEAVDAAPGPVLLLADDRPCSFGRYAARRGPEELVLLRFEDASGELPPDYLRETAHLPAFWIRQDVPLEAEAARYLSWIEGRSARPTRFCNPSEPRQDIAQRFARFVGLPHLTERQVLWVRDKAAMKDRFRALGLRTAAYQRVRTDTQVRRFAAAHGWPLVLKPVDSFACIDTFLLHGPEDLREVDLAARRWMVEQYLCGTEWEVCALVHNGAVPDVWPSALPCRPLDTVDGAMNAHISVGSGPGPATDVATLVQRVVGGMRIDHGYLHMEFFEIDGQAYAGEVGLRPAGCEIAANHGHAYGFDIFGAILDVYTGRRPALEYGERRCVGDLLLPLPATGTVKGITSREELLRLPGVLDAVLRIAPGDRVTARRASHSSSGYVHIEGDTAAEVETRMRGVLARFRIEVVADAEGAVALSP